MTETKRREYTITKFSLHPDGYLHCRITFEGTAYYCTEKEGSWMIPDGAKYKEILSPYKEELAAKGRQFRKQMAVKKKWERDAKATKEARISIDMGYKTGDIESALVKRYTLTKDEIAVIMTAAKQLPLQKEQDNGADKE